ncbi:glycosyl hydrolase [Saccharicrinis sp. FJH2]|uniref:glycosyl hydrolase n=1 Tax=Saccharicrinis sp. FJH65 TaxID=3344659 RepID=UPI0035F328EB
MNKIFKALIIAGIITMGISCNSSSSQKEDVKAGWPEVTNITKPWARWWWMGSNVKDDDISTAMSTYAKAGLGGMEITPIYGVKGQESEFINFTSDKWMQRLEHTLKAAQDNNMGIDMALASGWPFGGPWVEPKDACKYVTFKTWDLPAGTKLEEKIEMQQAPIMRAVGKRASFKDLKYPIAKNDSLQVYAFDQVRFPVTLKPVTVMAFAKDGEVFEVTDKIDENGMLNWSTDKDWTIIAAFPGMHGKMVERAGPGGEGDVIDHFSKQAIGDYLNHFDESFKGHDISGLRAFFNDSYEVDDARGEANWTPEFFSEFQKRRGYDLKEKLPALLGMTTKEEQQRIRCDYRQTISDMLLENYTVPWEEWAKNKGKIIRNQGHGSPANILDLYAASDIPETEGTDILNIKFASSAAHITGKKLTSAEAATWLREHFLANLADTKENVDRYLIGGINHIVYHGTAFSPESEGWPGRMFYAAVHYAPTNPLWRDFPAFNTYVTRVQSFLQRGTADNDILVYFPIEDDWMKYDHTGMQHYHGAQHGSNVYNLAEELQKEGYTFDFISDRMVKDLSADGKLIKTGGDATYKTILVPELDYISLETFKKLTDLSKQGATVIFMGALPDDVPGLGNLESRQNDLNLIVDELGPATDVDGFSSYNSEKGKVLVGSEHQPMLNEAGIVPEELAADNLGFIRLNDGHAKTYFVTNWSGNAVDKWINLNAKAKSVLIYNPETGEYGKTQLKEDGNKTTVHLVLNQGESLILQIWNKDVAADPYPYWTEGSAVVALDKNWNLVFKDGGPEIPESVQNVGLGSWTSLSEPASWFSGTAVYSTEFSKPEASTDAWKLDLGTVNETAEVFLNGNSLGTLTGPDFTLVIDSSLVQDQNKLEVYVTNKMANRIIYMDKHHMPYRIFYNINFAAHLRENMGPDGKFTAINWEPVPSGLTGPVVLTSLKKQ